MRRVLVVALVAALSSAVEGCKDGGAQPGTNGGCGVDCFPGMNCERGTVRSWAMATGVACSDRCQALPVFQCDAGCVTEGCSIFGLSVQHGADPARLCSEWPAATAGSSCTNDLDCLAPATKGSGDGGVDQYLVCADAGCATYVPAPGRYTIPNYMVGCTY